MSEIVFLRDAMMSRAAFEQLPACLETAAADVFQMARSHGGKLCRAIIDRGGEAHWHAIAIHHFNGTERALASRIIVAPFNYQPEE